MSVYLNEYGTSIIERNVSMFNPYLWHPGDMNYEINIFNFSMLGVTSITINLQNNFFQCRHILMSQTDSSAYDNQFKKLKHYSVIISC